MHDMVNEILNSGKSRTRVLLILLFLDSASEKAPMNDLKFYHMIYKIKMIRFN